MCLDTCRGYTDAIVLNLPHSVGAEHSFILATLVQCMNAANWACFLFQFNLMSNFGPGKRTTTEDFISYDLTLTFYILLLFN